MPRNLYNKVSTIVFGDLHIGDEGFQLKAWESMTDQYVQLVEAQDPDKVLMISLGDNVSGSNIYPNQDLDNIVGRPHWQVSAASELYLQFIEKIRTKTSAPIEFHLIKGHHDRTRKANLAINIHKDIRAFAGILDFKILYDGVIAIINIGTSKNKLNLLCRHGSGSGSKYYPISYSLINDTKTYILQQKTLVDAIVTGHFHWFSSVRFNWGPENGIKWYTIGSYQTYSNREQAQLKYGVATRPYGTWSFYNGKATEIEIDGIVPKFLEFQNLEVVSKILKSHMTRLEANGFA
jgi:hypothetical protein